MTPESRKCAVTEQTSVARQWLAETRFRGNEYACINQGVFPEIVTRFVATESNRGQSTVRLGDLYSVRMKFSSRFRHPDRESRVEVGSNTSTVALRVVRCDGNGSLESETAKYGRESRGTRTRE
jgi:hypothetical protein